MRRRAAVLALLAAAPAIAQRTATARVGVLTLASTSDAKPFLDAFREAMRELGLVEGRHIAFDFASADGRADRLDELAAQLTARKPDLLVVGAGNVSARAAMKATSTTPILLTTGIGVVENGLAQSLARPGGNVTGVALPEDLGLMQVQLLREVVPGLARLAVLVRADARDEARRERTRQMAQQLLQLQIDYVAVSDPDDIARALEAVRAARPQALIVAPDALLYQLRDRILQFARSTRLPDMHFIAEDVQAGGLLSLSPNLQEALRIAARMAKKLLDGARAAEMPFEQPTRFEIAVNRRTARALGLVIPQSVLLRADRVID